MKQEILSILQDAVSNDEKLPSRIVIMMRSLAGGNLCSCVKTGIPGLEVLDERLHGTDDNMTERFLLDIISMDFGHATKGAECYVCTVEGEKVAKLSGLTPVGVDKVDLEQTIFQNYGIDDAIDVESVEFPEDEEIFESEDEYETEEQSESYEDEYENEEQSESYEDEYEDTEDLDESEESDYNNSDYQDKSVNDSDIKNTDPNSEVRKEEEDPYVKKAEFFKTQYLGKLQELEKLYSSIFSSGYSVRKPSGILCEAGIVTLSGTANLSKLSERSKSSYAKAIAKFSSEKDITYKLLYDVMKEKMRFEESSARSINAISNEILVHYSKPGKPLVYFPYKMLEFAYGRKAPEGDNQNSLNTYTAQAVANSWEKYYEDHVIKSLTKQVGRCIGQLMDKWGSEMGLEELRSKVVSFVSYFIECFSLCLLIPDYREANGLPVVLKMRVSDPRNSLGSENIIPEIIRRVYMGSTGKEALTQKVAFYGETGIVKEYSHEFNRTMSQAMPIFAYKALEVLLSQGEDPSWDSMVLGQYENGSILRNGISLAVAGHDNSGGTQVQIALKNYLSHIISAGSRAGKGVTTLSFLTNAIASGKSLFYIDRKPDMASVLKQFVNGDSGKELPPKGMFIMNGADWRQEYDSFNQWVHPDNFLIERNIPDYVRELFKIKSGSLWYDNQLGDIFYMRAFKLIFGLIIARGAAPTEFRNNPLNGGKEGIVLIADESTNFQSGYERILDDIDLLGHMPPFLSQLEKTISVIEQKTQELEYATDKSKISIQATILSAQRTIEKVYKQSGYCLVTMLTAIRRDIDYLNSIKNAGFDKSSIESTDIITIGQALEYHPVTSQSIGAILDDGRYKQDKCGVKGGLKPMADGAKNLSLLETLIRFQSVDAILGRNDKHPYLAQEDKKSPAYGKLDDKARYFGYVPDFTVSDQDNVTSLSVANKALYFKPYLILNDCQYSNQKDADGYNEPNEEYTRNLIYNATKNGLSKKELVFEYGNGIDVDENHPAGTYLHPAVGLGAYLEAMGVTDLAEVLSKSGPIADHIVRDYLGYTGVECDIPLWLQFVTDLRMEWEFSIKDIADACLKPTNLSKDNPNMSEYFEFQKMMSRVSDTNGGGDTGGFSFKEDNISASDAQQVGELLAERKQDEIFNDDIDNEEYIDNFFDEDGESTDEYEEGSLHPIEDDEEPEDIEEVRNGMDAFSGDYYNNRVGDYAGNDILDRESSSDEDLIRILEERGYSVSKPLGSDARVRKDGQGLDTSYITKENPTPVTFEDLDSGQTSHVVNGREEVNHRYSYNDINSTSPEVTDEIKAHSYSQIMKSVTNKLIKDFGGLARISTLKVVGGGLVVNNVLYQCKVDASSASRLPFDIQSAINNGQIASLFDYSVLIDMKNLNTLSFDSTDFVFSYVAPLLGYNNGISVDKFFHDLKALNVLNLAGEIFTRDNHREKMKENDAFYAPSRAARYATSLHEGTKKANQTVWGATKSVVSNKSYPNIIRWVGALGLGALALGLGVARMGTSVVDNAASHSSAGKNDRGYINKAKGFVSSFTSSVKDAFNGNNNN